MITSLKSNKTEFYGNSTSESSLGSFIKELPEKDLQSEWYKLDVSTTDKKELIEICEYILKEIK